MQNFDPGVATGGTPAQPRRIAVGQQLAQTRLRELLAEVEDRVEDIVGTTRDRMDGLLEAVLAVSSGLDLDVTLRRIVQAAMDLCDARFGALGVVAADGSLSQFINLGIDDHTRELIGQLPTGHGVLGIVIDEARPLRLDDLSSLFPWARAARCPGCC